MLLSLYRTLSSYRGFILGSVQREFQARYRNSLFGALWTVLNPLSMIIVYTVIFSHIMRARLPGVDDGMAYSIYLCAGLLTWGLFAEITVRSQNMFLDNANLLKKISFPRICLPVIVLLNAGINFAIIIGLFLGFLLITGRLPGLALLALIPLLALQVMFCAGLGIILGVLNPARLGAALAATQPPDQPDHQLPEHLPVRAMACLEFAAADHDHQRIALRHRAAAVSAEGR
jgi:lipopolysaccharide transport system permease protein